MVVPNSGGIVFVLVVNASTPSTFCTFHTVCVLCFILTYGAGKFGRNYTLLKSTTTVTLQADHYVTVVWSWHGGNRWQVCFNHTLASQWPASQTITCPNQNKPSPTLHHHTVVVLPSIFRAASACCLQWRTHCDNFHKILLSGSRNRTVFWQIWCHKRG